MQSLGIRFDVSKIESCVYGIECWKVFWQVIDIQNLGGVFLFEGDADATLNHREKVYCIAVQSFNATVLGEIRAALELSTELNKIAASPKFVESDSVDLVT